jgi:hypothetical protein
LTLFGTVSSAALLPGTFGRALAETSSPARPGYGHGIMIDSLGSPGTNIDSMETPLTDAEIEDVRASGLTAINLTVGVKTDKSRHPQGQAPPGKALVYVFEVERTDAQALKTGAVTIRIGLDGQWVGANHGNTYFYFPVDPGDHNLCANWQSTFGRFSKLAAAVSLTAETGQVYYFLTKVDERSHDNPAVWMEAVDPAEAKLLIASASLSDFHPKK